MLGTDYLPDTDTPGVRTASSSHTPQVQLDPTLARLGRQAKPRHGVQTMLSTAELRKHSLDQGSDEKIQASKIKSGSQFVSAVPDRTMRRG